MSVAQLNEKCVNGWGWVEVIVQKTSHAFGARELILKLKLNILIRYTLHLPNKMEWVHLLVMSTIIRMPALFKNGLGGSKNLFQCLSNDNRRRELIQVWTFFFLYIYSTDVLYDVIEWIKGWRSSILHLKSLWKSPRMVFTRVCGFVKNT